MTSSATLFVVHDGIATLTLNRPDRLNAFDHDVARAVLADIARTKADPSVRALVLTGAGRGFCAGADLTGLAPSGPAVDAAMRELYNPMILGLAELGKPSVAAINGVAAGAGVGLALACDIAVAARSASFVLTFGPKLGLVPDLGCTAFLPRAIGAARARALALLGDKLPAEKAAEWGLVWTTVDDDACLPTAMTLATRLARGSGETFAEIRRLMDASAERPLSVQLDDERMTQARLIDTPTFRAGVADFLSRKTA